MQMVDAITTNETSWFRDQYPYQVLREKSFRNTNSKLLRGRENESISGRQPVPPARSPIPPPLLSWTSTASRITTQPAITGCIYSPRTSPPPRWPWPMRESTTRSSINRGLQQDHLDRYFKQNTNYWKIDDRVKEMVSFKPCNLKSPTHGKPEIRHHFPAQCDDLFLRQSQTRTVQPYGLAPCTGRLSLSRHGRNVKRIYFKI